MFSSLLIANRGEIAVRIINACRELGITSIAVYSDEDRTSMHSRLADIAVPIGGGSLAETYLDSAKLVEVAVDAQADAVHPGYGFLSEDAGFCRQVGGAGLTFVGPPPDAIESMGNKMTARAIAKRCGASPVPGTFTPVADDLEVLAFGEAVGYPIVIKAAFGGGGRGMRVVARPEEVPAALGAARREAVSAFGRGEVYLEKYLVAPRHVEVQILADRFKTVLSCGTRDCSVQRRHQKLLEEAPAPGIADDLVNDMSEVARRLGREVGYVGAGTLEFLVEDGRFYFLEMNTRIQVEHPVTEEVAGIDLVAEQIRVAAGQPLRVREQDLRPRGHAIECRINAEELVGGQFVPSPGTIEALDVPHLPGVRWDAGYVAGDELRGAFDSLIGKLVAWGGDRRSAIERAKAALGAMRIAGIGSTVRVHQHVLSHQDFIEQRIFTGWLEKRGLEGIEAVAMATAGAGADAVPASTPEAGNGTSGGTGGDRAHGVELWIGGRYVVVPPLVTADLPVRTGRSPDSRPASCATSQRGGSEGTRAAGAASRPGGRGPRRVDGSGSIRCPMQGTVVAIKVKAGDEVGRADVLLVVEAMKMENPVRAPQAGRVTEVAVSPGDTVRRGDLLAVVAPSKG